MRWQHLKANVEQKRVHEMLSQRAVFPPAFGIGLVTAGARGTAEPDRSFTQPWFVGGALIDKVMSGQVLRHGCSKLGCSLDAS